MIGICIASERNGVYFETSKTVHNARLVDERILHYLFYDTSSWYECFVSFYACLFLSALISLIPTMAACVYSKALAIDVII